MQKCNLSWLGPVEYRSKHPNESNTKPYVTHYLNQPKLYAKNVSVQAYPEQ